MYLPPDYGALSVALGERDAYTERHCMRVRAICALLGRLCGLNSKELGLLSIASVMHDIGKIGIPDHILLKPGKFSQEEWEVMKTHTLIGQRICNATPCTDRQTVGILVRHHHENIDGSGYPDGLAGEEIPIQSRIIMLADSYDALTTTRPYHLPHSHSDAMRVLAAEAGYKHDPVLYRYFSSFIETSDLRAR